jgi:hypothetical protein
MTIAVGNTSVVLAVADALNTRVSDLAAAFEFYRYTKLRVILYPLDSSSAIGPDVLGVLGYFPEELTATPTSIPASSVYNCEKSCATAIGGLNSTGVAAVGTTVNQGFTLSRRDLLDTPVKWYLCNASTEDTFLQQGTLIFAATTAAATNAIVANVGFEFEVEFTKPRNANLLRSAVKAGDDEKEEDPTPPPSERSVVSPFVRVKATSKK